MNIVAYLRLLALATFFFGLCQGEARSDRVDIDNDGGNADSIDLISTSLNREMLAKDKSALTAANFTNLPRVFLIGAQKAGTESMFEVLIGHPKLCGSNGKGAGNWKESHFFSGKHFDDKGNLLPGSYALYQKGYDDAKCMNGNGTFCDGTPMMHGCSAIFLVYSFYPPEIRDELRFIAILREPVSRDWSGFSFGLTHYKHFGGNKGKEIPILDHSMSDAFKVTERHYAFFNSSGFCREHDGSGLKDVFRGKYVEQLEQVVKYFKRSQLLVLNVEQIFEDPDAIMGVVQKFLGLKKGWKQEGKFPIYTHPPSFEGDFEPLSCSDRDAIGKLYNPYNERLYKWLASDKNGKKPPMEPPFRHFKSYKEVNCK